MRGYAGYARAVTLLLREGVRHVSECVYDGVAVGYGLFFYVGETQWKAAVQWRGRASERAQAAQSNRAPESEEEAARPPTTTMADDDANVQYCVCQQVDSGACALPFVSACGASWDDAPSRPCDVKATDMLLYVCVCVCVYVYESRHHDRVHPRNGRM
jgi:hypothetical protein